jgi:hypothetical protein
VRFFGCTVSFQFPVSQFASLEAIRISVELRALSYRALKQSKGRKRLVPVAALCLSLS